MDRIQPPAKCDLLKELYFRDATAHDVESMQELIFEHGPNQWNYLPEEGIRAYLASLAEGRVLAQLALYRKEMIGFITFHLCRECAHHASPHGHLTELVVHRDFRDRGIGTDLLRTAVTVLTRMNVRMIVAERHEEHAASARTLEKAGFQIVETYYDPERRFSSTRNTTLSQFVVAQRKNHETA